MDVNYFFYRQQISLLRAKTAAGPESRAAHEGLAKRYTEQIMAYRDQNRRAQRAEHERC
ncbi:MAG TPA: hypothetical protein VIR65_05330 [Rhizorhapis sp.]